MQTKLKSVEQLQKINNRKVKKVIESMGTLYCCHPDNFVKKNPNPTVRKVSYV